MRNNRFWPIILILVSNISILEMDAQESTFISPELPQQKTTFTGKWIRIEPDSIVLEIVEYTADSFAFTMINYNPNFYGNISSDDGNLFKYAIYNDSVAYFYDEGAIVDGKPLYRDDEEPCELIFKKTHSETILIGEKNCYMIYGGAGITWEGEYWEQRKQ